MYGYTLYEIFSHRFSATQLPTQPFLWNNGSGEEPAGVCRRVPLVTFPTCPFSRGLHLSGRMVRHREDITDTVGAIVTEERRRQNENHFSHHPPPLSSSLHPIPFSLSFALLSYYHPDYYQTCSSLTAMERRTCRPHGFGERFQCRGGLVTKTRGPIKSI